MESKTPWITILFNVVGLAVAIASAILATNLITDRTAVAVFTLVIVVGNVIIEYFTNPRSWVRPNTQRPGAPQQPGETTREMTPEGAVIVERHDSVPPIPGLNTEREP